MKCLRTLNLSRNKLTELPNEIGELIHLRYMDLTQNHDLKELPDAVCDLYNLQTLVLRWCFSLEKLPKAMGKLINLKHLYVWSCTHLRYLPKEMRSLKNLRVLDEFPIHWTYENDEEALKLGDLGIMDQLQGSLCIRFVEKDDAKEMEKAQLGNKEHLLVLEVQFQESLEGEYMRKDHEELLKAMQPHKNLESLSILCCDGTTESLYWIRSLHNLRRVTLKGWQCSEVLPPLGKLHHLKLWRCCGCIMWKRSDEFVGIEDETETFSGVLFPKLKQLTFIGLPKWEQWDGMINDSSAITIMSSLSYLEISLCPKLKALPDFLFKITTLRTLVINDCPILQRDYRKDVGKEWHNISHIPNVKFVQLKPEDPSEL